ncbi:zinc finger CCCH domain-containing protein 3-like isoform X2, partial [Biomphalaria glabrata]
SDNQHNFGHLYNTLDCGYSDSDLTLGSSCEDMESVLPNSNRLVLPLAKTSVSSLNGDRMTTVAEPTRLVLLGDKGTTFDTSQLNILEPLGLQISTKPSKETFVQENSSLKNSNETSKTFVKYLDYLEEMELKIRYMKNDIEFKQNQISARNNLGLNRNQSRQTLVNRTHKHNFGTHPGEEASYKQHIKKHAHEKVKQKIPPALVPGSHNHQAVPSKRVDRIQAAVVQSISKSSQVALLSDAQSNNGRSKTQLPVYVSPNKRKLIFSSQSSEDLTKSVPVVRKVLFQGISPENIAYMAGKQNSTVHNSNTATSRFKLVKNIENSSRKAANGDAQSSVSNNTVPTSTSLRPQSETAQLKKVSMANVQNASKLVSKYKIKHLSPTSAPKMAPSINGHLKSDSFVSQSGSNSLMATPASKKQNLFSFKKSPLIIQSAAKLVSKYKLKRISPTSASKKAPIFYQGTSSQHHKFSFPRSSTFTKFNKNKLKLDKRNPEKIRSDPSRGRGLIKLDRRVTTSTSKKVQGNQSFKGIAPFSYYNTGSFYKWSRPTLQANNFWRLKMRQKLRLGFMGTHRYASFKINKSSWPSALNFKQKRNNKSLVKIGDHLYKSNSRQLTRIKRSTSFSSVHDSSSRHSFKDNTPQRSWKMQKLKLISLQGVHFNVDSKGKKLSRAVFKSSTNSNESIAHVNKIALDQKRSDENARLAASRAVYRSIAIAAAKYKKDNKKKIQKQHCIFFGRFGKCFRGDNCPYLHDPQKVAVCTRFLRGRCDVVNCPFSHKASVHKMPVCMYYLRGACSRDDCPYLHVKVNPDAPTCKDFLNGFCSLGDKCKRLHSFVCPTYSYTGSCRRGVNCPMLHRQRQNDVSTKQKAPISVPAKRESKTSEIKPFIGVRTEPIAAQPSYISLTTEDNSRVTINSSVSPQEKNPETLAHSSLLSLLSRPTASLTNDSTRIRPAFLSPLYETQSNISSSLSLIDTQQSCIPVTEQDTLMTASSTSLPLDKTKMNSQLSFISFGSIDKTNITIDSNQVIPAALELNQSTKSHCTSSSSLSSLTRKSAVIPLTNQEITLITPAMSLLTEPKKQHTLSQLSFISFETTDKARHESEPESTGTSGNTQQNNLLGTSHFNESVTSVKITPSFLHSKQTYQKE